MVNYNNTNSSVNTVYKDLSTDDDALELDTRKFGFILSVLYFVDGQRKYYTSNDTVFTLDVSQVIKTSDSYTGSSRESQEIGYSG